MTYERQLKNKIIMVFSNPFSRRENVDPSEDNGLKAIQYVVIISIVGLIVVSIWSATNKGSFWPTIGLSGMVALAAMLIGGFLGFLFGIPRSLQRSNVSQEDSLQTTHGQQRPYSNNTNLEQISDWLTKIIVGVSLTQLPAIERNFTRLADTISSGFEGFLPKGFAYPFVASLIIFYSICGFLAVYLWAKIYLLQQLTVLDNMLGPNLTEKIERVEGKLIQVEEKQVSNEISEQVGKLEEFNKLKNKITHIEAQPEFRAIVEAAKPEPVKFIDDCQKGRWGGQSVNGNYKLSASFHKKDVHNETYELDLIVECSVDSPFIGDVYFFLHDSYYPDCIKKVTPINNIAHLRITSYEAFTVGVVGNNGNLKLELDLNRIENAPEDYKYFEPLITVDEIKSKLETLKLSSNIS